MWAAELGYQFLVYTGYLRQASYGALVAFVHSTSGTSQSFNRYTRQLRYISFDPLFSIYFGYWLLKYHESESRGRWAVRDWSKVFRSQAVSGPDGAGRASRLGQPEQGT